MRQVRRPGTESPAFRLVRICVFVLTERSEERLPFFLGLAIKGVCVGGHRFELCFEKLPFVQRQLQTAFICQ